MPIVAGVMVRRIKEKMYAETGHLDFVVGERVVVETEHGQEVGMVCEREKMIEKPKDPIGKILRKLTPDDKKRIADNEAKGLQAHKTIAAKIEDHELDMKLTTVHFTFDRSKLFVYYTAESRVDFRELIKDLGHMLKTRIQMVQIGVRDESRMIGGIGTCGRQLCCQSFLKDFSSVTIDMAKEQDLSLNTAKLSGLCGRLMCCIGYEHNFYRDTNRKLPPYGATVTTPLGQGTVTGSSCIKEEVTVHFDDGQTRPVPLADISNIVPRKPGAPAPAPTPAPAPAKQNGHGHPPHQQKQSPGNHPHPHGHKNRDRKR
jgi:cell fate regulator YaaT (PSP1 superfamily)